MESGKILLRPEEAARALSIARTRIYELMASGKLRSVQLGRSRRIAADDLRDFVRRQLAEQTRDDG
jgi:excisionase family DNA binding protein